MPTDPSQARSVLISVNPKAGRRSSLDRAERLRLALTGRGFETEIFNDLSAVSARANELVAKGKLRALVGAGGDGTAAELVNRTNQGTPVTLLPSGTANLIAKRLRLPSDPLKCAQMVDEGETLTLDAGEANGRIFLVMFSAGPDAETVRRVHEYRTMNFSAGAGKGGHISYASYLKPVLSVVRKYAFPKIRTSISGSGHSEEIVGTWSLIFNMPRYGWGLPLVPDCNESDGELDVCVFQARGLPGTLTGILMAQLGSMHRILKSVRLTRGERFNITTVDEGTEVPYQLDGDPAGALPASVRLLPGRFTVVVPRGTGARLGLARGS